MHNFNFGSLFYFYRKLALSSQAAEVTKKFEMNISKPILIENTWSKYIYVTMSQSLFSLNREESPIQSRRHFVDL